ncbi:MAG: GNAT family N-acetyltransferase [Actinomycetales bacterium]|nr:GNAT family N-acetyltransferase [Actinomycetales bacterium]
MSFLVAPVIASGTLGAAAQPTVSGRGVVLRPWRDTDVAELVAAYSDDAIRRWHALTLDPQEAAQTIERWRAGWRAENAASWAVAGDEDRVLGRVGFRVMHPGDGSGELVYWTMPAARGRGVARAAVEALVGWAFETGFHRLDLMHSTANPGSCRVALAAGFRAEGTLRSAVLHADGWHDMHLHARISTDPAPEGARAV